MSWVVITGLAVCIFTGVITGNNVMAQSAFAGNRLFMSAEERALIDAQLFGVDSTAASGSDSAQELPATVPGSAVKTKQGPRSQSVALNGVVVRPNAKAAVVWINNQVQLYGVHVNPVTQQVRIQRSGNDYVLSPGEKIRYSVLQEKSDD